MRRMLAAAAMVLAATLIPVRTAWSAPEVRLEEIATRGDGSTVALPHPSSHLGVRWVGSEDDRLELRFRSAGGAWSAWAAVDVAHDLGDEARGVILSGLLRAEHADATQAQVRVAAGAPREIEVVAIDTAHGPRHVVVRESAAFASLANPRVAAPTIVRRSEWGAEESLRTNEPTFAPITRMAVHHTATDNDDPDPAATVRAIYAYHTQSNGWNDIGYNFLVDANGRVYEGRFARAYTSGETATGEDSSGRGVIGAHLAGNNTGTVGVALLGNFVTRAPSKAAVDSLRRVLAWKADRHDVDALGSAKWTSGEQSTIVGHRDAGSTACPGDHLYALLPRVRQEVKDTVAAARATFITTGYWMLGRDARIQAFGQSTIEAASASAAAAAPPGRSIAATPTGKGYWVLSSNGRVTPHGDAGYFGSTESMRLNAPAVRLEPTATGKGYWILGADGGVFTFGDAAFHGSTGNMRLNAPVISMSATRTGRGYWLLASDGGVFTFGDGLFHGSTGDMRLNAPVVSMAPHPSGRGYWLQAADGGIFSFGVLRFHGSVPEMALRPAPLAVQIRVTPTGEGYYVLAADGRVFTFGDARGYGSSEPLSGPTAAVDLALKTGPNS